ncbi:MAG: TetR/AcrR family transcriptional regulator [Parvularculaceae bacterium]
MKGARTREKFVDAAARLFQSDGYHGVGLARIVEESGAPKGSFYFHFKGGKADLALAAIAKSEADVSALLAYAARRADGPDAYVRAIASGLMRWLKASGYAAGCPVAGLTIELAAGAPAVAKACAAAYAQWTAPIARDLARVGVDPSTTDDLAAPIVAALEGGVVMCRASRSPRALDHVAATLSSMARVR